MATSGSIEIPFAAEWAHLRQERAALDERLARLEQERGRVSEAVLERVREDYAMRRRALEARASDLAARAREESGSLGRAVDRQEEAVHRLRFELEEFDLRERIGELLDGSSARRAAELRREIQSLEADLAALIELQRQVGAIAEGSSPGRPAPPSASAPPPSGSGEALPPIPPFTKAYETIAAPAASPAPEPPAPASPAHTPAAPVAARPRLIPLESADGSDAFVLEGPTIVGRTGDIGLRLLVGTVSRRHAEIEPTTEGWVVRDLHSENGTWVNGERVWERVLVDGDQVQFGSVAMIFRAS